MVVPAQALGSLSAGSAPVHPSTPPSLVALPWQESTGILPSASERLGAASPDQTTSLVITLNVRDPAGLAEFVNRVSDPGSPLYAHFLTEQQFVSQYSPPASVEDQMNLWLAGYGLHVTYVAPDHRSLYVTGTLGQVSHAFGISFYRYHTSNGYFFAPSGVPSVPSAIAPWILSIAGLSNERIPITDYAIQFNGPIAAAGSQGQHTLTHDPQFHQIYQLDQLYNSTGNASAGTRPSYATGTNVAPDLWNDTPSGGTYPCIYQTSDLNTFFNTTNHGYYSGLPAVKIQPHYKVPTYAGLAPNTNTCASLGADGEVAMDFEAAASTAPGVNLSYTWVSSSTNWNAFIAMLNWLASNDESGANLELNSVSQSWGAPEQYDCTGGPCLSTTYETDYQQLESMGVSVFSSSADYDGTVGNAGTASCSTGSANPPSLQEPGSFPYTMSVGGVAFTSALPGTTAGDNAGAQVWNWGCTGGTGAKNWIGSQGGVSQLFPEASYQYGYNVNSSMAYGISQYNSNGGTVYSASSARPAPDWSGPADNLEVYVQGAWQNGYGGTSDSSPATAGLVAELDAFDGHDFGFINPLVYSLANENLSGKLPGVPTLPAIEPTYQIQNWSNDATGQSGTNLANFHAATNYNLSTGWGIPLAWNLANLGGKPWIATNPAGAAIVGSNYPIAAAIQDYRSAQYVNVTYKAPGASTWSNASLSLATGNGNKGGWTGSIPGAALTTTGVLDYCVYAIDSMEGNSWSPWNQSGWVVNGHGSAHPWNLFGCNHPFTVPVTASSAAVPVSFIESGLPAGTNWTVVYNSQTHQSTGLNITFNVTKSSTGIAYTVNTLNNGAGTQYVPTPASGTIAPSAHTSQAVTFATNYHLSTSASPAAGGSVTPASGWQASGASVTITATANAGYSFTGWAGNGTSSYTGTTNPYTWTISGAVTEVADFAATSSGTVPVSFVESGLPAGQVWSVTYNGVVGASAGLNITFNMTSGSSALSYSVPSVAVGAGTQYVPTPASGTVTPSAHVTTAVSFATQYYLTTSANPSADGTVSPASGWYASGAAVTISATANAGYVFSSWSGTGTGSYSGTAASTSITMSSAITEIANFAASTPGTVPVTFTESGLPAGQLWSVTYNGVVRSATGLNITFNQTTGSSTLSYTVATVSGGSGMQYLPSPASGSVAPSKHVTTAVAFTTQYYLTTSANPSADGTVTPASGWVNSGSSQTITATANAGYVFTSWSGTGTGSYSGTTASTSITVSAPITEIGNFATAPAGTVPIVFLESGLPAGQTWLVTYNSVIRSATGLNITFNVTVGSSALSYAIATVSGTPGTQYVPTPASGTVTPTAHTTTAVAFATQYYLTMSANPSAGGTVSPASGWQSSGAAVSIGATANVGYVFSSWSGTGTGSYSGSTASTSITMSAPITEIGNFATAPAGTVPIVFLESGLPAGQTWLVTYNSVIRSATGLNITFNVTVGTSALPYSIATVSGTPGTQYVPAPASGTVTPTAHTTTAVAFTTQYYLTMSANPAAGGTVTPASGWQNAGATPTISAVAGAGYVFSSWSGTGTGSYSGVATSTTVTMSAPITEIGNFATAVSGTVPIVFLESGLPAGQAWLVTYNSVIESATGLNITFNVTVGTSALSYSVATVSGTPGTQYVPSPASGTVTPSVHTTTAVAFATQYYLTMSANPSADGTVTPASGWQNAGATPTITATAGAGYVFSSWSGTGTGSYSGVASSTTVTMSGPIAEIGNFAPTSPGSVPITFIESGLPGGQSWTVTYNGLQSSSTGLNITFNVTVGSSALPYSVPTVSAGAGTQFVPSPASGNVTPSAHATTAIAFAAQYYVTLSASPASEGSVSPSSGWWASASVVTITATASAGYVFTAWTGTGNGNYTGTSASTTITVAGPITEIAQFQAQAAGSVPISFLESGLVAGSNWSVVLDGIVGTSTGLNITFNVTVGTSYAYSAATLAAGPGTQYVPTPASGTGTASAHGSTSIAFAGEYYLTVSVNPTGSGTAGPSSGWQSAGASVALSATAAGGYSFQSWSGSGAGNYSGLSPSGSVTMNGPVTEIANFGLLANGSVLVSFQESGLAPGTSWSVALNGLLVSVNGLNISYNVTAGTYGYAVESPVQGAPGVRYLPSPASGTLTVGTSSMVVAIGFVTQFAIQASASPSAGGSVTPSSGWYNASATASFSAVAVAGYQLTGWSCAGTGCPAPLSGNPVSFSVTGPANLTANFVSTSPVWINVTESGLPAGTGWWVTLNGVNQSAFTATIPFLVQPGNYTYRAPATISSGAWEVFLSLAPSGSVSAGSSGVAVAVTYLAFFQVASAATPSAGGSVTPGTQWDLSGSAVSLQATPANGYVFTSWSGTGPGAYSGTSDPATVTVTGSINETANFAPTPSYAVTFSESGLPTGTAWSVTFAGATQSGTGTSLSFTQPDGVYAYSASAAGSSGVRFLTSSAVGTVTVSGAAPAPVVVPFYAQYLLTVSTSPAGAGTASPASGWYNGTSLQLTATPGTGYAFGSWSGTGPGAYSGSQNPVSVTPSGPVTEKAVFTPLASWIAGFVDPAGATLTIDNQTVSVSGGIFNDTVSAGRHYVQAKDTGYQTVTEIVGVASGSGIWLNLTLPTSSSGTTGTSTVSSDLLPLILGILIAVIGAVLGFLIGRRRRKKGEEAEAAASQPQARAAPPPQGGYYQGAGAGAAALTSSQGYDNPSPTATSPGEEGLPPSLQEMFPDMASNPG